MNELNIHKTGAFDLSGTGQWRVGRTSYCNIYLRWVYIYVR